MQETGTGPATILQFRQDSEAQFRKDIREALEVALRGELGATRASARHERTDRRRGYRNGVVERTITTTDGTRTVKMPRGRVVGQDGATDEFHSQLLPRYARRTREIDEAILACYLGGVNSRRIWTAAKPLLGERQLSKSAVSRIVARRQSARIQIEVFAQLSAWLADERLEPSELSLRRPHAGALPPAGSR